MFKTIFRYFQRRYKGYYLVKIPKQDSWSDEKILNLIEIKNMKDAKNKVENMLLSHKNELDKIGFLEETDKASISISEDKLVITHDYLRHYDLLLNSFRQEKFSLIEFGAAGGSSLRMWEKYFPHAEIYGVDLDENAKRHEKGRIHMIIGDATSHETYEKLKSVVEEKAFIIIDDASHAWGDQRRSFELFWDILAPGGFYIIEDLECGTVGAYPEYPPKVFDSQPFFEYMQDRSKILRWAPDRNPEQNSYHFEDLPKHIQKIEMEINMCIFVPGAIIARKKS